MGREIVVHPEDTLIVNGWRVEANVLTEILKPEQRVLWAFLLQDGQVQPCPYDESKVIWLTDEDLVRND